MDNTIIRVEKAALTLGEFCVSPIELEIPQGYIVGIRGANGAGKSVFLRMLLGEFPKMKGRILVDGLDVIDRRVEMLQRVGFVSDTKRFFMVEDADYNERLYAGFYPSWDGEEYRKQLENMKLSTVKSIGSFSTGEYVKYQLAFAAAYRPKVLYLDEPTANLDPVFRDDFLRILQQFVADYETTILISTHLDEDLSMIADYTIQVDHGIYQMTLGKQEV